MNRLHKHRVNLCNPITPMEEAGLPRLRNLSAAFVPGTAAYSHSLHLGLLAGLCGTHSGIRLTNEETGWKRLAWLGSHCPSVLGWGGFKAWSAWPTLPWGGFDLGQAQWECTSIVSVPKVAGMGRLPGAAEWDSDTDNTWAFDMELSKTCIDY